MDEFAKTLQTIYKRSIKWEKTPSSLKIKKIKKKKEANKQTNKNRPLRNRISILTGTAVALQCSTQWAAGKF